MTFLLLMLAGAGAGLLGAMLGVGGGIVLVPALVLVFGVPMAEAVPASLLCVVATSCGAAASYVEHKLADVRLAISLELATVSGAIAGGFLAAKVAPAWLALTFGAFVLAISTQLLRAGPAPVLAAAGGAAIPVNLPVGMSGSFVAGGLSSLLGVGGGPLKVPLMMFGMRMPFKVAAATSNLMIGVTAAASVIGHALGGHLRLGLVAPLVVGVLLGAAVGSRTAPHLPTQLLKRIFAGLLVLVGGEMVWMGGTSLWSS